MKKIYRITAVLLVGILLLTAGCTRKPESPISQKLTELAGTTPAETIPTTVPMDPLEALRGEMEGTSYAFAVAYIGETYDGGEKDYAALLNDLAPGLCAQWPFLLEIPAENVVDLGWYEIYCIIPADPDASVRVSRTVQTGDDLWEYTDIIYVSETGEPILLICNCTEYWPDTQVTITSAGVETVWCPRQDAYFCAAPLTNESGESLFLDITSYWESFNRKYQEVAGWEDYRIPVKEDLVGKAWGWEGTEEYEEYYCTYLLGFEEDTAFIRWNDGIDAEDHEIQGIPWDLTHVDGYAVLTLDLGEFAGIRSYNLLYDEEYGWLYTMVDLSTGEVAAGDEIPFRHLTEKSLNAPEPLKMVGIWERFMWEADGYQEEDTSGLCTIVIAGETENTLTISYADRERPDFNYQDKALDVQQGEMYMGCGNSLWVAEVDHVGPWDTTYTVTLLEDGTLLVQNYFELDGAPAVSYEWYRRAEYGDSISPFDYALSQGWQIPELWELADTFWLSDSDYALELMDDSVSGDNGGWAVLYDVGENGAYTKSYNGSWTYEDGMLHLSLVPLSDDGYFVDDSFPVLMQDGYLWIGRNAYGTGLPHFYADQQIDILEQPKG
jgi:hypothetical protein